MPRFEFRTFGQNFGAVERTMRQLGTSAKTRESSEIYLISTGSNNAKIRHNRIDIKLLLKEEDGLEQWSPHLKTPFPIAAAIIEHVVFPAMGVELNGLARQQYSAEQYLNELVRPHPALIPVTVLKKRHGYFVHGCSAEIAELSVNGISMKTVNVEAEDAKSVLDSLQLLGLTAYHNINYVKALKRILGKDLLPE